MSRLESSAVPLQSTAVGRGAKPQKINQATLKHPTKLANNIASVVGKLVKISKKTHKKVQIVRLITHHTKKPKKDTARHYLLLKKYHSLFKFQLLNDAFEMTINRIIF